MRQTHGRGALVSLSNLSSAERRAVFTAAADFRSRAQAWQASVTRRPQYRPESLMGVATVFNKPIFSYQRGRGSERNLALVFKPGCFVENSAGVLLLGDHDADPKQALASTKDKTLELIADESELAFFTNRIVNTVNAEAELLCIRKGQATGASVQFDFIEHHVGYCAGVRSQIVTKARLHHVALTGTPGCRGTWVKILD